MEKGADLVDCDEFPLDVSDGLFVSSDEDFSFIPLISEFLVINIFSKKLFPCLPWSLGCVVGGCHCVSEVGSFFEGFDALVEALDAELAALGQATDLLVVVEFLLLYLIDVVAQLFTQALDV